MFESGLKNNHHHKSMWRHLSEIALSQDSGDPEEQILEKLSLDLGELDLPQEIYLRLTGSIADAFKKAHASPDHVGRIESLLIQVFVEADYKDGGAPRGDTMITEINQLQNEEITMRGQQSSEPHNMVPEIYQGWGYFVIEKVVVSAEFPVDSVQFEIRVFLYKEGAKN